MVTLYSLSIYLAAQYSRRLELVGIRARLQYLGWSVTGRWLDGEPLVESGDSAEAVRGREHFALEDLEDVRAASILVAFTEPPEAGPARGGRHVELGYALGFGKRVIVVGHRENIFCWLPSVEFCEDISALYGLLGKTEAAAR